MSGIKIITVLISSVNCKGVVIINIYCRHRHDPQTVDTHFICIHWTGIKIRIKIRSRLNIIRVYRLWEIHFKHQLYSSAVNRIWIGKRVNYLWSRSVKNNIFIVKRSSHIPESVLHFDPDNFFTIRNSVKVADRICVLISDNTCRSIKMNIRSYEHIRIF